MRNHIYTSVKGLYKCILFINRSNKSSRDVKGRLYKFMTRSRNLDKYLPIRYRYRILERSFDQREEKRKKEKEREREKINDRSSRRDLRYNGGSQCFLRMLTRCYVHIDPRVRLSYWNQFPLALRNPPVHDIRLAVLRSGLRSVISVPLPRLSPLLFFRFRSLFLSLAFPIKIISPLPTSRVRSALFFLSLSLSLSSLPSIVERPPA